MGERFLGVDFSGNAAMWSAGCRRSNVWIAGIEGKRLIELRRVQALPGDEPPFERLVRYLAAGEFRAAGIDAPFSIPHRHMPGGRHKNLLREVAAMEIPGRRPFAAGARLLALAGSVAPLEGKKPLRETERDMNRMCGATARSTLWNGARPGAPFTLACLTLLARTRAPLWPWSHAPGMLVEAFPMAQLRKWGLPSKAYGRTDQRAMRETIVRGMEHRVRIPADLRDQMLGSADALDAVVAAFGGMAASRGELELPGSWRTEGAIAVHD